MNIADDGIDRSVTIKTFHGRFARTLVKQILVTTNSSVAFFTLKFKVSMSVTTSSFMNGYSVQRSKVLTELLDYLALLQT